MKMYFLASAHFKWSVDSSCDVVPVEVHTSVFIKSILLSITQGPHAWNLQHVRSKNKYIIHFQSYDHVILWAKTTFDFGKTNKSTFIERSIYQSYLYFLTQILPLGVQWRKIIDKYQVCQYMVQKACRHFAHFAFISTWHATRVIGKKGGLL